MRRTASTTEASTGGLRPSGGVLIAPEGQRLTADDEHAPGLSAHGGRHPKDPDGIHAVRLDREFVGSEIPRLDGFGFDDVERARLSAAWHGVHQDRRLAIVEQRIGEIQASDAEVHDLHAIRKGMTDHPPRHLRAEGVVPQEDIADAGDQDPRRQQPACLHANS